MHCASCGHEADVPQHGACGRCGQPAWLNGRYQLLAMIGRGGNGNTWRAASAGGDIFAIKELPLRIGTPAKTVELFHREAAILQQLSHRGIPTYYEHFESGEGRGRALYLVMAFVEGGSLESRLRTHRFSEREVLGIMAALLEILVYLHSLSPPVIHRDIKPANVLMVGEKPVLIDFGSVRDALRDADLGGSTVAGTFGYMAPEQFQGDASPATDLYGLGALAVSLLTRKAPHTIQDVSQRIQWHPHAQVSPGLAALLDRLLRLDAADRPGSAVEVLSAVRALLSGRQPAPAGDDGDPPLPPEPQRPVAERPLPQIPEIPQSGKRIALSALAPGRMKTDDLSRVVTLIEHSLGLEGNVDVLGDSIRWTHRPAQGNTRQIRISLEPGPDGTRILVSENLKVLNGALFGGLLGGGIGGVGGGLGWMPFVFISVPAGIAFMAFVTLFFLGLAFGLRRRIARQRTAQLQALAEALTAELGGPAQPAGLRADEAERRRLAAQQQAAKRQL